MGTIMTVFIDVNCADAPIYFPNANPAHSLCRVNAINNYKANGKDLSEQVTLDFWGKWANVAACTLDKGSCISGVGELRSWTKKTGVLRPDGKEIIYTTNKVRVSRFWYGKETKKHLVSRIAKNLAAAKAAGKIPPQATITPEDLLAIDKNMVVDYNPTLAAQTGRYGNARVYLNPATGVAPQTQAPVAVPAAPNAADPAQMLEEMRTRMEALQAQIAAGGAAAAVSPF